MHSILNKRNNSLPPGPNPEEELNFKETNEVLEKILSSNSLNKINTDLLYKMKAQIKNSKDTKLKEMYSFKKFKLH